MLTLGSYQMVVTPEKGVVISENGTPAFESAHPVFLEIQETAGMAASVRSNYDAVSEQEGTLYCTARVETKNGSVFQVADRYRADTERDAFLLERDVRILEASGLDAGFSSEFSMCECRDGALSDYDVFVPGIWYRQNDGCVPTAFASSPYDRYYYFRATRMALPYVQLCRRKDFVYVALCHVAPEPSTGVNEKTADLIVDRSLQYPSLGVRAHPRPAATYRFPGSEGEKNYIEPAKSWARRAHPLTCAPRHVYTVAIRPGRAEDVYGCLKAEWRHWYSVFHPEIVRCDLERVYTIGAQLLNTYCQQFNGAMGIPFWATVPQGTVSDISFQIGFVGQQTMCAYHLMRYGHRNDRPLMVNKAYAIIDFWVEQSTRDSVVPRVWYDVFPPEFKRGYPTYTRTVTDGMEGILLSYQYAKRRLNESHDSWRAFCVRYADWLVQNQNPDGSFYRAYDEAGKPTHLGKFNTTNAVRFLVNIYWETGNAGYSGAALQAGEYSYQNIYQPMCYIGGTADNDNTIDKEAGMLALYAFLALYDLTGDEKWVEAAEGAALFCETWTYCWHFEVKKQKGNAVFDRAKITGLSLIATGHSHCDVMMAYCPFDFYRLYLLTRDTHYRDFAKFLLHNTKQTTDWSGALGHAYPGLVEESGEVATQYHNGLGRWLPWCSIAEIEPLSRFEEWFGNMDIDLIESTEHSFLQATNIQDGSSFMRNNQPTVLLKDSGVQGFS